MSKHTRGKWKVNQNDAVLSFSGDHITHVANIVKTDETSATDHMDEPSEFRAYAATKGGGK